jgi:hypothetical protein
MVQLENVPTIHHSLVNLTLDVPRTLDPGPLIPLMHRIFPALSRLSALGASDDYEYNEMEWRNSYL